jgi:hypothetical protein
MVQGDQFESDVQKSPLDSDGNELQSLGCGWMVYVPLEPIPVWTVVDRGIGRKIEETVIGSEGTDPVFIGWWKGRDFSSIFPLDPDVKWRHYLKRMLFRRHAADQPSDKMFLLFSSVSVFESGTRNPEGPGTHTQWYLVHRDDIPKLRKIEIPIGWEVHV